MMNIEAQKKMFLKISINAISSVVKSSSTPLHAFGGI